MIRFPVIQHLAIKNYQLFPGPDNGTPGIDRELAPGMNVVVGINGLGKTTLLNALFRVLSGPAEWADRDIGEPAGSKPTSLKEWPNKEYFAIRTRDQAKKATIRAVIGFGSETIVVERSLYNLEILYLERGGVRLDHYDLKSQVDRNAANEATYRAAVTSAAGMESFEDFFLVLRYLTFFLEERPPLVWDATAQSDLLRILFFAPGEITAHRKLYDQIQQADSRRRNLRPVYRKLVKRLEAGRAKQSESGELHATVGALRARGAAEDERIAELRPLVDDLDERRKEARQRVEATKLEIEELRSEYAAFEKEHLVHLFPEAGQIAQFVFLRRDQGCLVCGDRTQAAARHLADAAARHSCPVCDNPVPRVDDVVPSGEVNERRMEEISGRIDAALEALHAREDDLHSAVSTYDQARVNLSTALETRERVVEELDALQSSLPPSAEQLDELSEQERTLRKEMEEWWKAQVAHEAAFEASLAAGRARVEAVAVAISDRFSEIAAAFIEESCDLQYNTERRRIGQQGQLFEFPRFTVRMTSATSPNEPTPRRKPTDVSESQREYLDLAFRMAVMDVAAGDAPRMLVIETPEASLDVFFVDRAGAILGDFARSGAGSGNRLIVSSNLTGGGMIPALFGSEYNSDGEFPPHHVPKEVREHHLFDLLRLAAPSKALLKNERQYDAMYAAAIFPDGPPVQEPEGGGE